MRRDGSRVPYLPLWSIKAPSRARTPLRRPRERKPAASAMQAWQQVAGHQPVVALSRSAIGALLSVNLTRNGPNAWRRFPTWRCCEGEAPSPTEPPAAPPTPAPWAYSGVARDSTTVLDPAAGILLWTCLGTRCTDMTHNTNCEKRHATGVLFPRDRRPNPPRRLCRADMSSTASASTAGYRSHIPVPSARAALAPASPRFPRASLRARRCAHTFWILLLSGISDDSPRRRRCPGRARFAAPTSARGGTPKGQPRPLRRPSQRQAP